jgi:FkbH-like protein
MRKHPVLGWGPPTFGEDRWYRHLEDTLARGLPSAARKFVHSARKDAGQFRSARIAVLRTFSLELSESVLSLAFMRWRILAEFSWFDFNSFEPELLDPGSRLNVLHRKEPFDFVLLAWRLKDWIPEAWCNPTAEARSAVAARSLSRIGAILDAAGRIAPVICFPFDDHPVDAPIPAGRAIQDSLITEHHAEVLAWCAKHPERSAVIELRGRVGLDRKAEAFSHQPYTLSGQAQVAVAVSCACAPWLQPSAKVLVLDADGTLWGGIIGEDGQSGVQIGPGFPGNLHWELQLRAKFLRDSGVLLALVSKNDELAVAEMFAANPRMPLKWQDFSSRIINWDDKARNLARVAEELKLGLSSFVFLDDSPFERALVRAALPQVRVPETHDISGMLEYMENGVDFLTTSQTREDIARVADYAAQRSREDLRASATSMEVFLRELDLVATISDWSKDALPRIAQMLQKTNQFNLTTRRHTLAQLESWFESTSLPRWRGWTLSSRDRFAEQGIVGCLIARPLTRGEWEIDTLLLSCRALGRGYETALLSYALRCLKQQGATSVIGRYLTTERNGQVRDFYPRHGGCLITDDPTESVYRLDLGSDSPVVRVPEYIRLEEHAET